jgi:hypothetical protein
MKLWVLIFRYSMEDPWQFKRGGFRGGLDIKAYLTREEARRDFRSEKPYHPAGCLKVVRLECPKP